MEEVRKPKSLLRIRFDKIFNKVEDMRLMGIGSHEELPGSFNFWLTSLSQRKGEGDYTFAQKVDLKEALSRIEVYMLEFVNQITDDELKESIEKLYKKGLRAGMLITEKLCIYDPLVVISTIYGYIAVELDGDNLNLFTSNLSAYVGLFGSDFSSRLIRNIIDIRNVNNNIDKVYSPQKENVIVTLFREFKMNSFRVSRFYDDHMRHIDRKIFEGLDIRKLLEFISGEFDFRKEGIGEGLVGTVRDMLKEYGQVVYYRDEEGCLNNKDGKVRDYQEPVIDLGDGSIREEAIEHKDRVEGDNSLITYIVAKITYSLQSKQHRTHQWVVETSSQELQFKDEVAFWQDMMGIWVHWGYKLGVKISKFPKYDQDELFRRLFIIQRAQYQIVYGIPNVSRDGKYRGYFHNQP
jgi:hypothetical protein